MTENCIFRQTYPVWGISKTPDNPGIEKQTIACCAYLYIKCIYGSIGGNSNSH